jgi:hypothetical protein
MSTRNDGTHGDRILRTLQAADGAMVSVAALLQAMYGPRGGRPAGADAVLRVTMCHLRTRLPQGQLVAMYGRAGPKGGYCAIGYRLEVAG